MMGEGEIEKQLGIDLAEQMESQSPRQLRRYLDFEKKVKRGEVDTDFRHWISKIALDDGIYALPERAMAFEIVLCEVVVDLWPELAHAVPAHLFIAPKVSRLTLYLGILNEELTWSQRSAYWNLLSQEYGKHWGWIRDVHQAYDEQLQKSGFSESGGGRLLIEFCDQLRVVMREDEDLGLGSAAEINRLREQIDASREALKVMEVDLEFAEDRADRAHARIKKLDEEIQGIRRQLVDERENGEKLRSERRSRIANQRASSQAQKELEILRGELVRAQERLQDMAQRLALSEQRRMQGGARWNMDYLQKMNAVELLGIEAGTNAEVDLGKTRRRFASALHPDRVRDLPAWTGALFSEIMRMVNEACDRQK